MNLNKDLWTHLILPRLSPIELCRFQQTSKRAFHLTRNFQLLNEWKQYVLTQTDNWCLNQAALAGHKDLVQLFINKGANDWNRALSCATRGGHEDLVHLFINKGAKDWDWALSSASEGGYKELVQFFIDKGANDWNAALVSPKKQTPRKAGNVLKNVSL